MAITPKEIEALMQSAAGGPPGSPEEEAAELETAMKIFTSTVHRIQQNKRAHMSFLFEAYFEDPGDQDIIDGLIAILQDAPPALH